MSRRNSLSGQVDSQHLGCFCSCLCVGPWPSAYILFSICCSKWGTEFQSFNLHGRMGSTEGTSKSKGRAGAAASGREREASPEYCVSCWNVQPKMRLRNECQGRIVHRQPGNRYQLFFDRFPGSPWHVGSFSIHGSDGCCSGTPDRHPRPLVRSAMCSPLVVGFGWASLSPRLRSGCCLLPFSLENPHRNRGT